MFSIEGLDRLTTKDIYTDNIVLLVANNCNNTIIIFYNTTTRLIKGFVDHPNVIAIIFIYSPGQLSRLGLIDILYSNVNLSGKLLYIVTYNQSDYSDLLGPALPEGIFTLFLQVNFTESIYINYRHFNQLGIKPYYEFGFGLSYITFEYSRLTISKKSTTLGCLGLYLIGAILPGRHLDL
jgi:beta-glucosidase